MGKSYNVGKDNGRYIKDISKEFLVRKYIINKKTIGQIAKIIHRDRGTIRRRLIKYSIPIISQRKGKSWEQIFGKEKAKKLRKERSVKYKGENNPNFGNHKLAGKNHPNYIHGKGKEPYPLEFNNELKEKIFIRDNHTCQLCGTTQEEHFLVYGFDLDIHHIDYDKKNCKEENLVTTCRHCNSRVNFNREYWKKYFSIMIEVKNAYSKIY